MERTKDWKDFHALVSGHPDYQIWLQCKDPEEKALRRQYLDHIVRMALLRESIGKTPMPRDCTETCLSRAAVRLEQSLAASRFMDTLFEFLLQEKSGQNLNLLFAFLETYHNLLKQEYNWCQTQNIPPDG